jgi:hypothetical protein
MRLSFLTGWFGEWEPDMLVLSDMVDKTFLESLFYILCSICASNEGCPSGRAGWAEEVAVLPKAENGLGCKLLWIPLPNPICPTRGLLFYVIIWVNSKVW